MADLQPIIPGVNTGNRILTQIANRVRTLISVTKSNIIEIGYQLERAHAIVPFGQWERWVDHEFGISEETANRWRRVARQFNSVTVTQLTNVQLSALYELASDTVPPDARSIALQNAQNGEFITIERAKAIIVAVRETLADDTLTPRQRVSTMQSLTDEIESAGTVSISGVSVPATDETVALATSQAVAEAHAERAEQIARHSQWEQCQTFEATAGDATEIVEDTMHSMFDDEPVRIVIYTRKREQPNERK